MPKLKPDLFHELEMPIVVLSTKYHKHLGTIENIDPSSMEVLFRMNAAQEIYFNVYKELDGHTCTLWDSLVDLKYIYIPDYEEYYEISVSLNENDQTIKQISGTSACEAELSQRLLRDFECNTESDILRENYAPTIFYDPENQDRSLLHRILRDKCPDYTIRHVDSTLSQIQRVFSCDKTSVYDFLTGDIAEEIGCLFQFDSVNRSISVYDLNCNCNACHYRGAFTESCPECGSTDINQGYGGSTDIFISKENFADEMTVKGDADGVKNCIRIEGGDDLMTATVTNCNPNGSEYIYQLSKSTMEDMPEDLIDRLTSYGELYDQLKDDYEEYTKQLYEAIDQELYLTSEMMPAVTLPDTSASQELNALATELGSVSVQNITTLSKTSGDLAVNGMAKVIIDPRYQSEILSSTLSGVINGTTRTWTGRFRIFNRSDEEDTAESTTDLSVTIVGNDYEEYLYQKIQKALDREDALFLSVFEIQDLEDFKIALKDYCLNRLKSFESSYQTCIEVLIENGVTDQNSTFYDVELYNSMYQPYYQRILAIQNELVIREGQIAEVQKINQHYSELRNNIQRQLDFQNYLGEDLWLIFCSYVREDTYSNSNYVSDGLSNRELIDRARELFAAAQKELSKASELQISLTTTLENLLSIKEFKDFRDKIDLGNWIICQADEALYRLRIIEINLKYSDLSALQVTFSNVEKVQTAVSDVQSILSQAQSMAGSFSYVAHQASQGKEANDTVEDYRKVGLDTALYRIINCGTQDVIYDEHGISCRKYDDVLDDYLPEQLRIINNTIAFTSDNWKTVSAALGKLRYRIDGVDYENYGLNADHVIAGVVIGGDIYSGNYSSAGKTGTHINLTDGTFSFAGGALTYNGSRLSLTGDAIINTGKIGDWNINKALYSGTTSMTSTTAGTYIGIDGFRNYRDNNHYVNITNGVITANGATITGVIHATGGTFSDTITCTGTIQGGTISGSTIVSNNATIQGGKIGGWTITGNAIYNDIAYTGAKNSNSTGIGSCGSDWAFWAGNGKFWVKQDGSIYAENANIAGTITANYGRISSWTILPNALYNGISYTGAKDSDSTGIGNYGTDWAFWAGNGRFSVKQNGTLYASNANISGTITATSGTFDNVTINGSCRINGNSITSGTINANHIADLAASKITSGTLSVPIDTKVPSTFDSLKASRVLPNRASQAGGSYIGSNADKFDAMYASVFVGTLSENSSKEIKTNIKDVTNDFCLQSVLCTEVKSYNYKTDLMDIDTEIEKVKAMKLELRESLVLPETEEQQQELERLDTWITEIKSRDNYIPETRYGFVSEDAPYEIVSKNRKTVDTYSCIAMTYGSIQALYKEIQSLRNTINELQKGENK